MNYELRQINIAREDIKGFSQLHDIILKYPNPLIKVIIIQKKFNAFTEEDTAYSAIAIIKEQDYYNLYIAEDCAWSYEYTGRYNEFISNLNSLKIDYDVWTSKEKPIETIIEENKDKIFKFISHSLNNINSKITINSNRMEIGAWLKEKARYIDNNNKDLIIDKLSYHLNNKFHVQWTKDNNNDNNSVHLYLPNDKNIVFGYLTVNKQGIRSQGPRGLKIKDFKWVGVSPHRCVQLTRDIGLITESNITDLLDILLEAINYPTDIIPPIYYNLISSNRKIGCYILEVYDDYNIQKFHPKYTWLKNDNHYIKSGSLFLYCNPIKNHPDQIEFIGAGFIDDIMSDDNNAGLSDKISLIIKFEKPIILSRAESNDYNWNFVNRADSLSIVYKPESITEISLKGFLKICSIENYILVENGQLITDTESVPIMSQARRTYFNNDTTNNKDLLNIDLESKVISNLITMDNVTPLSIGLFGEWGSGKSFLMKKIIDSVKEDASNTKKYVQIEFNTWHYVDTNLFASLANHILVSIAEFIDPNTNYKSEIINENVKSLEVKKSALEAKNKETQEKLNSIRKEKESKNKELLSQSFDMLKEFANDNNLQEYIRIAKGNEDIEDIKNFIQSSKTFIGKLKLFWQVDKKKRFSYLLLPIIFSVLVLLITHINFNINGIDKILQIFKIISVGSIVSAFTLRINNISTFLDSIFNIARKQDEFISGIQKEKELKLEKEERNRLIEEINRKISKVKSGQYLDYLVSERLINKTYEKHLGLVNELRRDFELINQYFSNKKDDSSLDRIILYLDDLDRCPENKVVEVLEAVHLLLSFDLFVVIVAADVRWISKCLQQKYQMINTKNNNNSEKAQEISAYEYMEKIFQITIKPQVVNETKAWSFIEGLCQTNQTETISHDIQINTETNINNSNINDNTEELAIEQDISENTQGHSPNADEKIVEAYLETDKTFIELTASELSDIKLFTPLMKTTPRRIKRYINTYRLVKASYKIEDENKEVLFLLCIGVFFYKTASYFFDIILDSQLDIIGLLSIDTPEKNDDWDRLKYFIKKDQIKSLRLDQMKRWISIVERYSFCPSKN